MSHFISIRKRAETILLALAVLFTSYAQGHNAYSDTVYNLEEISVTAIKHTPGIDNSISATQINGKDTEKLGINAIKNISEIAPNVHMPDYGSRITSSIYVRGMGTRIDQPVIGLNIDNIPIMDKNNYDFDIPDIAHLEMFRGPQSTLFGRNTMGGVINIYTLSPLSFQGVRIMTEYASGNSRKVSASAYHKIKNNLGISISGQYSATDGFFTNEFNGKKCDKETQAGGRLKLQWRQSKNLHIDNTFFFSILRQGGYPYQSVANKKISYNDTCFYRRNSFNDGLTIKWITPEFTLSSISSIQYIDDNMTLDQDFMPQPYFTLTQKRKQYAITQDIVFKSKELGRHNHITGLFGFYKHLDMDAPVTFKDYGIEQLIEKHRNDAIPSFPIRWDTREFLLSSNFSSPGFGVAAYHQSSYIIDRWILSAGLRLDYEQVKLTYYSHCNTSYSTYNATDNSIYAPNTPVQINQTDKLNKSFLQLLPKITATYKLPTLKSSRIFFSISKGYKAGGFNTQMFSDVLQQEVMGVMGISSKYDINEVVGYKPEQSWNFETGSHIESNNSKFSADLSLFYIHCKDQQLTRFPDGNTTGRIMTNAGKARSFGVEAAISYTPIKNLALNMSYGYTNAKFIEYNNGKADFAGKHIPYSPTNTIFAGASYTIPSNHSWLDHITLSAHVKGTGEIYWDEANTISQPFYATAGASIRFENKKYSLDFWGQNLTDTDFNTFYFVSIGNAFLQHGKPRIIGVTLRINI